MHITLHFTTDQGQTAAINLLASGFSYGPNLSAPGRSWVQALGDSEHLLVNESPSEIAALIQAARDEEWRRQLVCAIASQSLPALPQLSMPTEMIGCAASIGMFADAIIAADKERRHADKG